MKIGILITSVSNFGEKGFYNSQEIGLAKALGKLFEEVVVYKLIPKEMEKSTEEMNNIIIHRIPAPNFGINGMIDVKVLDSALDTLIYFSDTQFSLPRVYRWSVKNNVRLLPYIGVIESHSTSAINRMITNCFFGRNLKVYQKLHCCVKTPTVGEKLKAFGVKDIEVTPVGLDLSLLRKDYMEADKAVLKQKYGFEAKDQVLLFIGRMIDEKRPLQMIELFADILKSGKTCKLLMVGTGPLENEVENAIEQYGIGEHIKRIDKIPNSDIWELYRIAEAFVNLNQQEIFGMAILEAMYYGCKVVAWKAPGPNLIIKDKITGNLVNSEEEAIEAIFDEHEVGEAAHERIVKEFTWNTMASYVKKLLVQK